MDVHTKQQRSYNMSRIRSKDTKPEVKFRKYVWNKGLRNYRVHRKLPGKPDLYFGKSKVAVFIDGCFWHQCPICFKKPKTNKKFWSKKIRENVERDLDTDIFLEKQGINVIRLWEHEIKKEIKECYKKLKKELNKKTYDKTCNSF
jgi:DNA mismatch endonuclease (patch repair protein)